MSEVNTSLKSILEARGSKKDAGAQIRAEEEESEYKAFAFGRVSIRPQLMVDFYKADGFHLVLPYMDLKSISTSNPANGFVVEFTGRKFTIEGCNLADCFRFLRENRVSILIEADRCDAMRLAEHEAVIYKMIAGKST